ncbi:MAG TPA: alcohol dehydrogenase catalytic domain-containing protein [Acidimicrobiales bacterium]|jgi:threonine dehydrogenase-like Zn-dependent dehydrogenase|nr:alcohol dehydrogenase catalytic domain-containing protein [Acidimicrobiales bacterium]
MKQLTLVEPGTLEWQAVAAPVVSSPTGAVVRPVAAATCDFDHLLVSGAMPLPMPIAVGHEFVAEVVEVGSGVGAVEVGDVVVVSFQASCGTCDNCRRGLTSACGNVTWLSAYGLGVLGGDRGGAMSDLVVVPWADAMLRKLPPSITPHDVAAASCNIPDAYRAVAPHLDERPGAQVFIVGGAFGNISHYSVLIAKALGAGSVDYFSPDAEQAAKAERLGARVVGSPVEVASETYEVVVDNSQNPDLLALAVRAAASAGVVTATTMYPDARTPVPLMDMFARCVTFSTGQPHVAALLDDVLGLIATGRLDPAQVVDEVAPWDAGPDVFRRGSGKAVCVR